MAINTVISMAISMIIVMAMVMVANLREMRNNVILGSMTDLHTHILPAFDDGAEDLTTSLNILRRQKECGIERVALTPHFYPMREDFKSFIRRREKSYQTIMNFWDNDTMPELRLGAEVRFSPALLEMDLRRLTLGDSNYMLIELPDVGVVTYLEQVVENILSQGIVPILAHVEHCSAFLNDPNRLFGLIHMGVLAQVEADAFLGKKANKFAKICMERGLAHIIASDIHNLTNRSVCLQDVSKEYYTSLLETSEAFARAIWDGNSLPDFVIKPVKKNIFGYR